MGMTARLDCTVARMKAGAVMRQSSHTPSGSGGGGDGGGGGDSNGDGGGWW